MTKNALIWGSGGAIADAVIDLLVEQGWQVAAAGRRQEQNAAAFIEAEVDDDFSVQMAVNAAAQELGEVNLWVYAVGDIASRMVSDMILAEWQRIVDANLTGAYLTTHHSLPLLAKEAHLFYIGALSERMRLPGLGAYAAAKAGLEALAEVVRKETRRRVSMVRPGAVDTPFWNKVPFRLPAHHLKPPEVAARILQAYQEGHQGLLDL
jgi:NAD(P)-dependent dehydrogenase (short-subunit alcohol dehydrogenase family)